MYLVLVLTLDAVILQVKCIEFHPMQPWLAIADKGGNVSVWDLKTEQLVYETTVGTPDDVAMQDALLQRAAEKEPDYFGPQLSQVLHPPPCQIYAEIMLLGCQAATPLPSHRRNHDWSRVTSCR